MSKEKDKKRILKNISFNVNKEKDMELLEYAEGFDSFGSYVKDLIKRDMEQQNRQSKEEINSIATAINDLVAVFKEGTVSFKKNIEKNADESETAATVDNEQKSIIGSVLNMPIIDK